MKNYIFILKKFGSVALLCSIVLATSCTDDYDEINTNKNKISEVGTSELPFLFSKAQSTATNNGWNYQIAQNLFHDQYCQYFANTTTYFPSDRLVIRMDWIRAAWNPIYTEVVPQLQKILADTDPASAEHALATVWWVYTFHRLTDTWGPVPYKSAGIFSAAGVPYDPQDVIYNDLFLRLDSAVSTLEKFPGGKSLFTDYDLIYGGDLDRWKKFANTLRLRLAVRISKVEPARAKTEGEKAAASGTLTDPRDNALIVRTKKGDDFNGLAIMDWNEFRMSAAMESVLKGYADPRMPIYFLPAKTTGNYEGLRNGLTSADMAAPLNKADANSHHGDRWNSNTGLETPSNVMATAEADFLKAEGVLLGWNMGGGTAKSHYEKGILNSMLQWGITDNAVITSYINSTSTPIAPGDFLNSPPVTDVPVLFGATTDVQKEQITLQKWLALYPEGVEAWADIRRSGAFKLYPVANSDNPDLPSTPANPTTNWIRRIPFLNDEKISNGAEVRKAEDNLLNGPDKITTPLWWDKN
jgi:hypothetical protein